MLAYEIVVVALASDLTWVRPISRYPAGRHASLAFRTPLFGLLALALLRNEPISAARVAALILVGIGIYLVDGSPVMSPALARR